MLPRCACKMQITIDCRGQEVENMPALLDGIIVRH